MTRPQVWLIDPDGFTPFYDVNLAANLTKLGWTVHFAASSLLNRKLQSSDCSIRLTFAFFGILTRFPLTGHATQARAILLRRLAKACVYPVDLFRLSLRLLRGRPGIAHVQWALFPFIDMFFWYVWRRRGWVVIHTIHDPIQLEGSPLGPMVAFQRKLCMAADRVIVHDRFAAVTLLARGVPRARIQVIPRDLPSNPPRSSVGWHAKN